MDKVFAQNFRNFHLHGLQVHEEITKHCNSSFWIISCHQVNFVDLGITFFKPMSAIHQNSNMSTSSMNRIQWGKRKTKPRQATQSWNSFTILIACSVESKAPPKTLLFLFWSCLKLSFSNRKPVLGRNFLIIHPVPQTSHSGGNLVSCNPYRHRKTLPSNIKAVESYQMGQNTTTQTVK